MVDELNDEREAEMDRLEDRTRALAARCDAAERRAAAAEKERDAYKKAKAENDARFQRERDDARAERDAAVKAKEEAEAREADLVAQSLDQERVAASLRAQVEQVRGALEKHQEALIWCSGSSDFGPEGKVRSGWLKMCAPLLDPAALSPSPASGVAEGKECARCQGEGKIANSDEGEPWSAWSGLPPGSDMAVRLGVVKPIDCPACGGAGKDGGR